MDRIDSSPLLSAHLNPVVSLIPRSSLTLTAEFAYPHRVPLIPSLPRITATPLLKIHRPSLLAERVHDDTHETMFPLFWLCC